MQALPYISTLFPFFQLILHHLFTIVKPIAFLSFESKTEPFLLSKFKNPEFFNPKIFA